MDPECRDVDVVKISAINKEINEFFKGRPRNGQKTEWCSRYTKVPILLRDIHTSLKVFFALKRWHAGGPIPDELLYTKRNFRILNNIALVDALDLAFDSIRKCVTNGGKLARTPLGRVGDEDMDTMIALRIIHECEYEGIMQDHIGGLLVLYLELCERVELL